MVEYPCLCQSSSIEIVVRVLAYEFTCTLMMFVVEVVYVKIVGGGGLYCYDQSSRYVDSLGLEIMCILYIAVLQAVPILSPCFLCHPTF